MSVFKVGDFVKFNKSIVFSDRTVNVGDIYQIENISNKRVFMVNNQAILHYYFHDNDFSKLTPLELAML